MNKLKLLEAIRSRPQIYLCNSKYPFTSLQIFLLGYDCGFAAATHGVMKRDELVPGDFTKFVTEKFGGQYPAGGKGWQTFIEENTSSEEEAFNLFFKLREEYDKQRQDK